jgi:hypothetical protein
MRIRGITIKSAIRRKTLLARLSVLLFLRSRGVSKNKFELALAGLSDELIIILLPYSCRIPLTIKSAARFTTKVMEKSKTPIRKST